MFYRLRAATIANHDLLPPNFMHKKGHNCGNSLFSLKLTRQWAKYLLFSSFAQKGICQEGGGGGKGGEGAHFAGGHF